NAEALTLVQDLTRGAPPPYGRLLRAVAYNARLDAEADKKGAIETASTKVVAGVEKRLGVGDRSTPAADPRDDAVVDRKDVEAAFAGLAAFGVPAPPPPKDKDPAGAVPPAPLPLDEYQEQLAFVRDALLAYVENPQDAQPLLGRLGTARLRIRALI